MFFHEILKYTGNSLIRLLYGYLFCICSKAKRFFTVWWLLFWRLCIKNTKKKVLSKNWHPLFPGPPFLCL